MFAESQMKKINDTYLEKLVRSLSVQIYSLLLDVGVLYKVTINVTLKLKTMNWDFTNFFRSPCKFEWLRRGTSSHVVQYSDYPFSCRNIFIFKSSLRCE